VLYVRRLSAPRSKVLPLIVLLPYDILDLRKEHMVMTVMHQEKREHYNIIAVLKGQPREPEDAANEEQGAERAGNN
jgi:hypothetical protein